MAAPASWGGSEEDYQQLFGSDGSNAPDRWAPDDDDSSSSDSGGSSRYGGYDGSNRTEETLGGSSDSSSSSSTDSSSTSSDYEDPFSGGQTGSEVIAEHGAPESVATIDPNEDSVEETVENEGAGGAAQDMLDLAQDDDDANDEVSFETGDGEQTTSSDANDNPGLTDFFESVGSSDQETDESGFYQLVGVGLLLLVGLASRGGD